MILALIPRGCFFVSDRYQIPESRGHKQRLKCLGCTIITLLAAARGRLLHLRRAGLCGRRLCLEYLDFGLCLTLCSLTSFFGVL